MKKNLPEIVFILDRSGSMAGLKENTIGSRHRFSGSWKHMAGSFLFLGANIDAAKEAVRFGSTEDHATNYHDDKVGTSVILDADYKKRGK